MSKHFPTKTRGARRFAELFWAQKQQTSMVRKMRIIYVRKLMHKMHKMHKIPEIPEIPEIPIACFET